MQQEKKWVRSGQQTKMTPEIKNLAKILKGRDQFDTIFNIFKWIKGNLKFVKSWEWRRQNLRKRTAQEIIKSRKVSGCGDKAVIFAVLARANDIPAKIVETLEEEWLIAKVSSPVSGHVFVDVFINGKWIIADPTIGNLGIGYNWPLGKRFVIYKKGLDSWNIGIKKLDDLRSKFLKFKEEYKTKKS